VYSIDIKFCRFSKSVTQTLIPTITTTNLSLKTDLLLNSSAKIQKKSLPVKSLRAAFWAAFWAATPKKPIPKAKERYVIFTQRSCQSQLSLIPILKDASSGFKQA
jgi:hypothetical protein